jgi:hypothetical protein
MRAIKRLRRAASGLSCLVWSATGKPVIPLTPSSLLAILTMYQIPGAVS